MNRTEELISRIRHWQVARGEVGAQEIDVLMQKARVELIQLDHLVQLQNAALKYAADKVYSEQNDDEIGIAIAAFNRFEGGE